MGGALLESSRGAVGAAWGYAFTFSPQGLTGAVEAGEIRWQWKV
jgi:hypothetical protein